jgi:hypothetical protein
MLPGAPVLQPPRSALETGDPNLATEVLPAPPTLSSVLQASGKRDPRKPIPTMSYLPQHDPGTTYAGVLTGPIIGSLESIPEVDGPRRKRVRLDKGYVLQCVRCVCSPDRLLLTTSATPSHDSLFVHQVAFTTSTAGYISRSYYPAPRLNKSRRPRAHSCWAIGNGLSD